jgi:RimJ/RimL family protein N-acetyltransferase
VLVRLGQEVQEVPRRLAPPDPPLADDTIRLEPVTQEHHAPMRALTEDDEVRRFTRVPQDGVDDDWVATWIERYERGWDDGTRVAFAILDRETGAFLGFAGAVDLELDARQAELGYMTSPAARGRGAATRALRLLTRWCLDELGLERLELMIDAANAGSIRVAERSGYRLEGTLRNVHVKDGVRADVGVWSLLPTD